MKMHKWLYTNTAVAILIPILNDLAFHSLEFLICGLRKRIYKLQEFLSLCNFIFKVVSEYKSAAILYPNIFVKKYMLY
jgi:hypothetical protein